MPSKEFLCKSCGDMHKRPINSKCLFVDSDVDIDSQSDNLPTASGDPGHSSKNVLNMQILAELKSLGIRMTAMEKKMSELEVTEKSQPTATLPATSSPAQLDQVVIHSVAALQGASHIQAEVD